MNDSELLQSFRENGSEESFRELVQRHLPMVYSVALRQVRNAHWAEEVAHAVFIALARKAGSLSDRTIITGWLYRATRFAASKLLRDEERRVRREREAAMEPVSNGGADSDGIEEVAPLVFEALDSLSRKDREAILLRFMEDRSFAEVAMVTGASEAAAKMRTGRALEKLRERLNARGIRLMGAALPSSLTVVKGPPHGLIESVSVGAIKQAGATAMATGSGTLLAEAVIRGLAWAELKFATVLLASILVCGAIGALILGGRGVPRDLTAQPEDIVQTNGWVLDGRNGRSGLYQGEPTVDFSAEPGRGIAWRPGFNLSEGVIETDIAAMTGHMGVAFWIQDSQQYSAVYFRPQNRPEDPVAGGRGVEYVALPDYPWQRLRSEYPGVYENAASLPAPDSGKWFHVRLEISGKQVRAFLDHSSEPCLLVTNLLTTNITGSVGFFMGDGSPGVFSHFNARRKR